MIQKLLVVTSLLFTYTLKAQPYSFTKSSATYSILTGATQASGSSPWSSFSSFTVPIGFTFNYMGTNYTSIKIEGSGFAYFDALYYHIINPFTVELVDKGTSSSLSPLSYKVVGVSPNKILKIEWKNCGFQGQPTSTANFQLWLYQTSNKIEVRIGNCTVVTPSLAYNGRSGPAIGIKELSSTTWCDYGRAVVGTVPGESCIDHSGTYSLFDFCVDGTPENGTVYEFSPDFTSIHEENEALWSVYPNPANNVVTIIGDGVFRVEILDLSGRVLLLSYQSFIDISLLPKGVYVIRINTAYTQKLVLQ